MSLRKQAIAGVRWTTVSSAGRVALQLLQVTVLARLLSPKDFGLVAVVVAIVAIVQIFADAGVSNAIIHYRDVTEDESDSLFWLNMAVSTGLAIALLLCSGAVAGWYAKPELRSLLPIAAASIVANAVGQQVRIVAQKHFRFVDLAKVELGGAMAGAVVALTVAAQGGGAYSLVTGTLATAIATSALAWVLLAGTWRPRMRMRWSDVRRFVRYGTYMIGDNLANTLNTQVDVLLGARLLGAQAIGLFSVSKDLSLRLAGVINPIVTEVSLPVMASAQSDRYVLGRLYLQMMRMIASVTFPAYVALSVFADEIVRVVLGTAWVGAAPLLRLLAIWAMLRSTGNPVGTLVRALGRPDLGFVWNCGLLLVIPPVIWIGSHYGADGMSVAVTVLAACLFVPNWYFLVRPLSGVPLGEYAMQFAVPLGLSLIAGFIGHVASNAFSNDLLRLGAGIVSGAAVYLGSSWYMNRPWSLAMLELVVR